MQRLWLDGAIEEVYPGNVKKNDLPELQQELRRLFIGKTDRLFLVRAVQVLYGNLYCSFNDPREDMPTADV
jgi:hypothetical protein